jgi:hypothetical protein
MDVLVLVRRQSETRGMRSFCQPEASDFADPKKIDPRTRFGTCQPDFTHCCWLLRHRGDPHVAGNMPESRSNCRLSNYVQPRRNLGECDHSCRNSSERRLTVRVTSPRQQAPDGFRTSHAHIRVLISLLICAGIVLCPVNSISLRASPSVKPKQ